MKQWQKFNINNYVRVKLTDYAKEIHRKQHEDLVAHIKERNPDFEGFDYVPIAEDEEGWSEWQMWVFMERFGGHMTAGKSLCSTEIEFQIR